MAASNLNSLSPQIFSHEKEEKTKLNPSQVPWQLHVSTTSLVFTLFASSIHLFLFFLSLHFFHLFILWKRDATTYKFIYLSTLTFLLWLLAEGFRWCFTRWLSSTIVSGLRWRYSLQCCTLLHFISRLLSHIKIIVHTNNCWDLDCLFVNLGGFHHFWHCSFSAYSFSAM